ncbi:MAG: NapC/NirT family cytochrome c [Phycisphaeraceae bacterium]
MSDDLQHTETGQAVPPIAKPRRPWWWRVIGIRRRRRARWIPALGVVPSLWGWCLILGVGMLAGATAFADYSMQPEFCRSCHVMEPYYQAWHDSTHKGVACPLCHFEPGLENTLKGKWQASSQAVKFITKTYGSKPHAEVRDSSCLRSGCHERRVLEGKVDWEITNKRGVAVTIRFDHTPHLTETRRGQELRCVSCHSQMVQGKHIVVTLESCFLCHMKGVTHGRDDQTLGGCRSCHEAPKEQIRLSTGLFDHAQYIDRGVSCLNCHSDSVAGDGAVPRQMCWNCHNQPAQMARYSETAFLHREHINVHKVECSSCHVQITHELGAVPMGGAELLATSSGRGPDHGSCGQCHERLHNSALSLYQGKGGRGVPDMPSPMFTTQVDCIACHRVSHEEGVSPEMGGKTWGAARSACVTCHGEKYGPMLDDWKLALDKRMTVAEEALVAAEARMKGAALDPQALLMAQRRLDDARHNIAMVRQGPGVHNVPYAMALLSYASDAANAVAPSDAPSPDAPQPSFHGPGP